MKLNRISTKRLIARYNNIIRGFYKMGGTTFGCDWPTMDMLYPEKTEECREIRKIVKTRNSKKG